MNQLPTTQRCDSFTELDSPSASSGVKRSLVSVVAGVVTGAVVLIALWQFDRAALSLHDAQVRADTARSLSAVRGAAESVVNKHVYLTLGLRSHVAVHPDLSAQEFANLAALIMADGRGIRSVTSIKDNVINDVYPREGNEAAIGLNLLSHPDQRAAAEHAIETGQPWLAGPFQLVQGGEAFINRAPVYLVDPDGGQGKEKYWGMVSILIDKQTLVEDINASVPEGLAIAIRGRDDRGLGELFLGDPSIESAAPMVSEITLPTGNWRLYGIPQGGWPTTDLQATGRRVTGGVLAVVFGLLVYCLVGATMRHRLVSIRLRQAVERERIAHDAAKQSALQAEQRAAELESAHLASLNILEDMEAARSQLASLNTALEQSNEELQQFAYVASHDLKTPLRAISGFAQILKDDYQGKLDEQADGFIDRITEGVGRMQRLIDDLLRFSRIDSRGKSHRAINLNEILEDVLALLQADIDDAGAEVTQDELPIVFADSGQITQLLQNLIGNGMKYCDQVSPRVHVSAEQDDGQWTIAVQDNGIGIAPEYHESVFKIFRRLHTSQEYSGTGIGLAVCRRIAQRHGGRLWLESAQGDGSTFYFTLQAAECGVGANEDGSQQELSMGSC